MDEDERSKFSCQEKFRSQKNWREGGEGKTNQQLSDPFERYIEFICRFFGGYLLSGRRAQRNKVDLELIARVEIFDDLVYGVLFEDMGVGAGNRLVDGR